jgi:riboflavin synthase
MFTGLIEAVCTVKSVRRTAGALTLTVDLGELANDSKVGDSIAVSGTCLTVARLDGNLATFDLSTETLEKSTLGNLKASSQVNIERAMKATDRFGGHIVQGHIDGTATIKAVKRLGQFADIEFTAQPELLNQMVAKGSVAVDGISLTIASIDQNSFRAAIIPETLTRTTLGKAKVGDAVNIETDIIVKIIENKLESAFGGLPQAQPLTVERLKQLGF